VLTIHGKLKYDKRNVEDMLEAGGEVHLDVNAEKIKFILKFKFIVMSCQQNTGQNHSNKVQTFGVTVTNQNCIH